MIAFTRTACSLRPPSVPLIKRGVEDGGRKIVNYVPNNFHQTLRLLIDEIGIDSFVCTVSSMDRHGYFSFGTGNDYSTSKSPARPSGSSSRSTKICHASMATGRSCTSRRSMRSLKTTSRCWSCRSAIPAPEDAVIGRTIAGPVPDGACLADGRRGAA